MSFWTSLGEFAGEAMGKMAAIGREVEALKIEYEGLDNDDLMREYKNLEKKYGLDERNRRMAVRSILIDRGIIKNSDA